MHSTAKPHPEKADKVFEIRDLTGKVVEIRPTYWTALIVAYSTRGIGNFTIEKAP